MIDYIDAVDLTYNSRWAGTKDGARSRTRALHVNVHLDSADPFTPAHAFTVRDRLVAEGMAPGTVNRHLAAYFTVWRTLVQRGLLQQGPPSGVLLREPRGRTRVVTLGEVVQLERRLLSVNHQYLARFLYETGCRVSEALDLRCGDLNTDPAGWSATFQDTKNGDDRTVPLGDGGRKVAYSLFNPANGFAGQALFLGVEQGAFNRDWDKARTAMGLSADKGFVPHALRHTYATRLVVAGVPLPVVAKLLGHRSIKTTLRYTHVSLQDSLDSLRRAGIL